MSKIVHKLYAYFLYGKTYNKNIPIEKQIYLSCLYEHLNNIDSYTKPPMSQKSGLFKRVEINE